MSQDLQGTADAIVDIQRHAVGGQSGRRAQHLHDQAFPRAAQQPQSAERVVIEDLDLVEEDMDDIGVVPGRLGRQVRAPHDHAVGGIVAQAVEPDERAEVGVELREPLRQSRRAPWVRTIKRLHRVGVDADGRPQVVLEDVIHDHRLGAADEDHRAVIAAATAAVARALAARIILEGAVGQTHVGLVNFHGRKQVEAPFDRRRTAGKSEQRVIDAPLGERAEE